MRPDLKRKRPAVEGPGANPKAEWRAQTDNAIIPPTDNPVNKFKEYLALATIQRAPGLYHRLYGGVK